MSRSQRKKTFVDATVQGALVRRIVIHWLVFVGVAIFTAALLQQLTNPLESFATNAQNLWWTHGPFILVLILLLPVFVIDTIKLSHRFAGPIFRLRRAMHELASGETPGELKFRGNDFWQELSADFNTIAERCASSDDHEPSTSNTLEVDSLV